VKEIQPDINEAEENVQVTNQSKKTAIGATGSTGDNMDIIS